MLLDELTWLAANLGLLGSPTPTHARTITPTLTPTPSPTQTRAISLKQRVTSAVTWALAVHAEGMVIQTANRSTCADLPWLATLATRTAGANQHFPLEWWISVERGDGVFKLLYLRPRALPQPSRHPRPHRITGIPIPATPSSSSTSRTPVSNCSSINRDAPCPSAAYDSSFTTAHERTVCDSAVNQSNDTSPCFSSLCISSPAARFRDNLENGDRIERFRTCSSSSSSEWNRAAATWPVGEFDLPFDESDPMDDGEQDSGFDPLTGSHAFQDFSSIGSDDDDSCTSITVDSHTSSMRLDSDPASPPPVHLTTRRPGFQQPPPEYLPRRVDTPTVLLGSQTPSAPPTPNNALASCASTSALLLFDQAAASATPPTTPAPSLCRFPTGSSTTSTTPSPPLTPKFNLITLAPPTSPPLTCPLPLPEAALSDLAVAVDDSDPSFCALAGSPFSARSETVANHAAWGSRQDCSSAAAAPPLSAGSILFT